MPGETQVHFEPLNSYDEKAKVLPRKVQVSTEEEKGFYKKERTRRVVGARYCQ